LKLGLVHLLDLLGSKNRVKNRPAWRKSAWLGSTLDVLKQNRKRGKGNACVFSSLERLPAVRHAGFRYNPFTAADEKVPLSVVQVNNKPQYLVFSLHSAHPLSKHGHLPVESSKEPSRTRISPVKIAPKSMQFHAPREPFLSLLQPIPRSAPPQGAQTVQNTHQLVEMWRSGRFPGDNPAFLCMAAPADSLSL
jgi:hypothetical protein